MQEVFPHFNVDTALRTKYTPYHFWYECSQYFARGTSRKSSKVDRTNKVRRDACTQAELDQFARRRYRVQQAAIALGLDLTASVVAGHRIRSVGRMILRKTMMMRAQRKEARKVRRWRGDEEEENIFAETGDGQDLEGSTRQNFQAGCGSGQRFRRYQRSRSLCCRSSIVLLGVELGGDRWLES